VRVVTNGVGSVATGIPASVLKGTGSDVAAATAGTDFLKPAAANLNGILKSTGSTTVSVAVAGTDYLAGWSETQVIYVGKHGSNSNDGTSVAKAVLTFQYAASIVPSGTPYTIVCLDGGVYNENTITLTDETSIYAPGATINCGVSGGFISIGQNSTVKLRSLTLDSSQSTPPRVVFPYSNLTGGCSVVLDVNIITGFYLSIPYVSGTSLVIPANSYVIRCAWMSLYYLDAGIGTIVFDVNYLYLMIGCTFNSRLGLLTAEQNASCLDFSNVKEIGGIVGPTLSPPSSVGPSGYTTYGLRIRRPKGPTETRFPVAGGTITLPPLTSSTNYAMVEPGGGSAIVLLPYTNWVYPGEKWTFMTLLGSGSLTIKAANGGAVLGVAADHEVRITYSATQGGNAWATYNYGFAWFDAAGTFNLL
jgi:hypothetical protein